MALRTRIEDSRRCPDCDGRWLTVEQRRRQSDEWVETSGSCLSRCDVYIDAYPDEALPESVPA